MDIRIGLATHAAGPDERQACAGHEAEGQLFIAIPRFLGKNLCAMTKLQRRLLVASVAVMFFLAPLVIMGNCSGWNEGSMQVASCAIDVAPLPALASMLYGLVLLSAFMAGLPILAYIVVALVGTRWVARVLRRRFPDNTVAKPWWPLLTAMALPGLVVFGAVALVATALQGQRAMSGVFAERCKTAVEVVTRAPDGPVEGLYFGSLDLPGYAPTDMVEDGWLRFSETLTPEPATVVASQYGVFLKDLTTDADRLAGIEGAEISVKKLATDETLATTTYFMSVRGGRYCSGGQIHESDSWVNGVATSFSYVPFLVRALGLTQRAGAHLVVGGHAALGGVVGLDRGGPA